MSLLSGSNNPDVIIGKWYTEKSEGVVEIFKHKGKYYGKLVELMEPNDANGKPRNDTKNRNSKLQSRPLLGIPIFWGMEYSAENSRWEGGVIYDPNMGHEAKGFITVIDDNTIKVKGYVGFEWVSKSQIWKRKV